MDWDIIVFWISIIVPGFINTIVFLFLKKPWLGGNNQAVRITQAIAASLTSIALVLFLYIRLVPKGPPNANIHIITPIPTPPPAAFITRVPLRSISRPPTQTYTPTPTPTSTPTLAYPTDLRVVQVTSTGIELEWAGCEHEGTGSCVYYSDDSSRTVEHRVCNSQQEHSTWLHSDPQCGIFYHYYVTCVRGREESEKSQEVKAIIPCTPTPTLFVNITPSITPTPSKPALPTPTFTPTYQCAQASARITAPRNGQVINKTTGIVNIKGAMHKEGYTTCEIYYRQVECTSKTNIRPGWIMIGEAIRAPIGNKSEDFRLVEWHISNLDLGCYELNMKLKTQDGNDEWIDRECSRIIVEIRGE